MTAEHRPATRRRRFRNDDLVAVDLFSGFGGLTTGIQRAGFTTIMAANHNTYKVEVHEANHPEAEHWIADLVDPESADYHSARDLPAADLLRCPVDVIGPDNDWHIRNAGRLALTGGVVVAAWGAHPTATPQRINAVRMALRCPVFCLGLTKQGAPRHPLYLPAAQPLERFDGC